MAEDDCPTLVTAQWLAQRLGASDLRVVDASWHLPGSGRDAAAEFAAEHIPGAVFFDIDRIADPDSDLPHMLPSAPAFAHAVGGLGIGDGDRVVVYDSLGLYSAARAWWMFRVFGHRRVALLDGGLPAWRAAGGATEAGWPAPEPAAYHALLDSGRVWSLADIERNRATGAAHVVDARPAARFSGRASEPRPGLPSGHIPGSRNIPYTRLIDPDTGRLRPEAELAHVFAGMGDRPVVCSCGTGVTACILAFGLHRLGRDDVAVYDGSWTEWGGRPDAPVATGDDDTRA